MCWPCSEPCNVHVERRTSLAVAASVAPVAASVQPLVAGRSPASSPVAAPSRASAVPVATSHAVLHLEQGAAWYAQAALALSGEEGGKAQSPRVRNEA